MLKVTAQLSKVIKLLIQEEIRLGSLREEFNASKHIETGIGSNTKEDLKKPVFFDLNTPQTVQHKMSGKHPCRGRRLEKPQINMLEKWFTNNIEKPYLNKKSLQLLTKETGLSNIQIKNWVSNRRRKEKVVTISPPLLDLLA